MAILSKLQADTRKEREGVWFTVEGIRFRLAFWESSWEAFRRSLPIETRERIREGRGTTKEVLELMAQCAADKVILDWEDMEEYELDSSGKVKLDEDGQPNVIPIPYSKEKARELMTAEEYEPLRNELILLARQREQYRRDLLEEARGN